MERQFIDPAQGFSQVVATKIGSVKTIHVSGQVGLEEGATAPAAGLAEQAAIALRSLVARLEKAGAGPGDIVKTTVFIKEIDPEKVRTVGMAQMQVLQLETYPASTWVGVTGLVDPRLLVEIEAIAMVEEP